MKTKVLIKEGVLQSDSFEAIREQVASALQNQVRVEENNADIYCWIQNLYTDRVVYCYDSKYYLRTYSIDVDDNVTFGDATQVEASWEADRELPTSRFVGVEVVQLKESFDESSGKATLTIISPGFNKSKGRYYPAATLKRDYKIFEGAKMFADHQTESESDARPEGSVHNWVGSLTKVWAESDGRIRGEAVIVDPPFKAKLAELSKQKLLGDMGVSIRALGEATKTNVEGVETNYVESLLAARSVDFVTFAGAGGLVEAMESAIVPEMDVDLVSEADLRRRRPELVKLIESKSEELTLKTVEQQLQEAQTALAAKDTELTTANTKLAEAEKAQKKTAAASELTRLLSESKLPDVSKKRIQKQFAEAATTDGMKESIDLETEYVKSLGPVRVSKNNGEADNKEVTESEQPSEEEVSKRRKLMVESYVKMGMTKEAAEVAANV